MDTRVLVIDDETGVLDVVEAALGDEGYEVVCARNDAEAYAILSSQWSTLAAVVADIDLGVGTTGYDVARYARRLNPELPVLYVTGGSEHTFGRHAVPNGALLTKPFRPAEMVAALADVIHG